MHFFPNKWPYGNTSISIIHPTSKIIKLNIELRTICFQHRQPTRWVSKFMNEHSCCKSETSFDMQDIYKLRPLYIIIDSPKMVNCAVSDVILTTFLMLHDSITWKKIYLTGSCCSNVLNIPLFLASNELFFKCFAHTCTTCITASQMCLQAMPF